MAYFLFRIPLLAALLASCLVCASVVGAPTFPELTARIVDGAGLLDPGDERTLAAELRALEDKSSDQLVIVTLPSLQGYTIEDFGYQLGRHWGIGTEELDNGVLLIVAPNERKVRIEVGYGLEPVLTDALAKIIIENAILPRFRSGDFAGGIKDGVRDIVLVLTGDAAEVEARAKARRDADEPVIDWATFMLYVAVFLLVMYLTEKGIIPVSSSSSRSNSRGGWSSGGGSFGGGGGGFSGGGGGFGGGGSSGGW